MTFMQQIILFLICYLCVYALVSRICQCFEHCATAKAYGKFQEHNKSVQLNDVEAGIKKLNQDKENVKNIL